MQDLPKPVEPLVVTSVTDDRGEETLYKGIPVSKLIEEGKCIEDVVWLLWTGRLPSKFEFEIIRRILIMTADHGPAVAGAYSTILATSAGLAMPQAVAAGVQMIGPKFGGASGAASREFRYAVANNETMEQFSDRLKSSGTAYFPGIGHKVFSKSKPDKRVKDLVEFFKSNSNESNKKFETKHLDFALSLEEHLLAKNEKLILNIDGAIGAILADLDFPEEGVDGFFILARTIGLIAHHIDQKQRGTGLIRLPEELILYKT